MKTAILFLLILVSVQADIVQRLNQRRADRARQTDGGPVLTAAATEVLIDHSDSIETASGVEERRQKRPPRPTASSSSQTGSNNQNEGGSGSEIVTETVYPSGDPMSKSVTPPPATTATTGEPFSRQVPLCILVEVVDDPYDDRMRTGMKYGKGFIPRVG